MKKGMTVFFNIIQIFDSCLTNPGISAKFDIAL